MEGEFISGQRKARNFFEDLKVFFPDSLTEGIDYDKYEFRKLWYLNKNPLLRIHGDTGVTMKKLEEASCGISKFVLDKYNLNIETDFYENSKDIVRLLKKYFGYGEVEGLCGFNGPDLATDLIKSPSLDGRPSGTFIVTNRPIKGGFGRTNSHYSVSIISTTPRNLELISAHEFIHNIGAIEKNCENDCLMAFGLREDGELCAKCNSEIRNYLNGLESVLNRYGRTIFNG